MTVAVFVAVLIVTFGMMGSGIARVVVFPEIASDFIRVNMEMQSGTAPAVRDKAIEQLESTLLKLNDDYVRENPDSLPMIKHLGVFTSGDVGARMFVEIPMDTNRPFEMTEISDLWRNSVGEIPGLKELQFDAAGHIGGGPPLSFRLSGPNYERLEGAAAELAEELGNYEGVFDITIPRRRAGMKSS